MKLRVDLRLAQKLIMTPQMQQAIKLLQLSRLELQQSITQYLMDNPLLEEVPLETEDAEPRGIDEKSEEAAALANGEMLDASDGDMEERDAPDEALASGWEEYFGRDPQMGGSQSQLSLEDGFPSYEQPMAKATSLEDHLLWQLSLSELSDRYKMIARSIIGNLDDDGYLRVPFVEIISDTNFTEIEVESVLNDIQSFDPIGVAARDLKECLLLQIKHLGRSPMGSLGARPGALKGSIVEAIIEHHLKDLEKKQYAKIGKAINVTTEEVFQATKLIEALEPKPGRPFSDIQNYVVAPDVFVVKTDGEWSVVLNEEGLPRLRITSYYKQLIELGESRSTETKVYLNEKQRAAQWVIRSIEQRNSTIIKVVSSIVKFQEQFFEKGALYLKPLVLKQVAEDIGMHESTISRVTANKYMHSPQGLCELKFFFNSALQRVDLSAEMMSSITVKEIIRIMVAEENTRSPLRDEEIAKQLLIKQIVVARRTVAKYRAEERIPSASQRKRFF